MSRLVFHLQELQSKQKYRLGKIFFVQLKDFGRSSSSISNLLINTLSVNTFLKDFFCELFMLIYGNLICLKNWKISSDEIIKLTFFIY